MNQWDIFMVEFLSKRDKPRRGSPLYTYSITKEEWLQLEDFFKRAEFSDIIQSSNACGLFILYCVGAINFLKIDHFMEWAPILQNVPHLSDRQVKFYEILKKGLKTWCHQSSAEGHHYIGYLVSQAGLNIPSMLTKELDNKIIGLVLKISRKLNSVEMTREMRRNYIRSVVRQTPDGFLKGTVRNILDLAYQGFRHLISSPNVQDWSLERIAKFNANFPCAALDRETLIEIRQSLLKQKEKVRSRGDFLSLHRYLTIHDQEAYLSVAGTFVKNAFTPEKLARFFKKERLGTQIRMGFNNKIFFCAENRLGQFVRIRTNEMSVVEGDGFFQAQKILCVGKTAGGLVNSERILLDYVDRDSFLVFRKEPHKDRWVCASVGSYVTASEKLLILVHNNTRKENSHIFATLPCVGQYQNAWSVYQVRDNLTIFSDQQEYFIEFQKNAVLEKVEYRLDSGAPYETQQGVPIYTTRPFLRIEKEGGTTQRVALEWFDAKRRPLSFVQELPLDYYYGVYRDPETKRILKRYRVILASEKFSIQYEYRNNEGYVYIYGIQNHCVSLSKRSRAIQVKATETGYSLACPRQSVESNLGPIVLYVQGFWSTQVIALQCNYPQTYLGFYDEIKDRLLLTEEMIAFRELSHIEMRIHADMPTQNSTCWLKVQIDGQSWDFDFSDQWLHRQIRLPMRNFLGYIAFLLHESPERNPWLELTLLSGSKQRKLIVRWNLCFIGKAGSSTVQLCQEYTPGNDRKYYPMIGMVAYPLFVYRRDQNITRTYEGLCLEQSTSLDLSFLANVPYCLYHKDQHSNRVKSYVYYPEAMRRGYSVRLLGYEFANVLVDSKDNVNKACKKFLSLLEKGSQETLDAIVRQARDLPIEVFLELPYWGLLENHRAYALALGLYLSIYQLDFPWMLFDYRYRYQWRYCSQQDVDEAVRLLLKWKDVFVLGAQAHKPEFFVLKLIRVLDDDCYKYLRDLLLLAFMRKTADSSLMQKFFVLLQTSLRKLARPKCEYYSSRELTEIRLSTLMVKNDAKRYFQKNRVKTLLYSIQQNFACRRNCIALIVETCLHDFLQELRPKTTLPYQYLKTLQRMVIWKVYGDQSFECMQSFQSRCLLMQAWQLIPSVMDCLLEKAILVVATKDFRNE